MNIVLCENAEKREYTAGNKARSDTVTILKSLGFRYIMLYRSKGSKVLILAQMILALLKASFFAKKNDVVIVQYPYYPAIVNSLLLSALSCIRNLKKNKICVLVHDSIGLRTKNNSSVSLDTEIGLLEIADYIIFHNEMMKISMGAVENKSKYIVLGPFDYIYKGKLAERILGPEIEICVAGNLSKAKSGFIYRIDRITNCRFNLYGIGYMDEDESNIDYYGSFSPDELIGHMRGTFGLVWDGEDINSCKGDFGEYLKYNCPHKFSLYIAAGLPVIVWDKSAIAEYVKKHKIGLCVSSLREIESISISRYEYESLCENTLKYREEITNGLHLKRAIETIFSDVRK